MGLLRHCSALALILLTLAGCIAPDAFPAASGAPALYISPDRLWRVQHTRFDCGPQDVDAIGEELLSLACRSTDAVVVDRQTINCGGLGAYGFDPLFWSPGSRYFYYTPGREGVPDGCGYWRPPIRQLDVQTGEIRDLGGGMPSPDGTRLAIWLDQHLVLWDLDRGELGRRPALDPAGALAAIAWSPDGRAVAYLQSPSVCVPGTSGKSVVARIDTGDLTQSALLESESHVFTAMEWDAGGAIRLTDDQGQRWILDGSGLHVPAAAVIGRVRELGTTAGPVARRY